MELFMNDGLVRQEESEKKKEMETETCSSDR